MGKCISIQSIQSGRVGMGRELFTSGDSFLELTGGATAMDCCFFGSRGFGYCGVHSSHCSPVFCFEMLWQKKVCSNEDWANEQRCNFCLLHLNRKCWLGETFGKLQRYTRRRHLHRAHPWTSEHHQNSTSAAAQRCVWRTTKYLTNEGSCGRAERHHSPLVSFWCTSTLVQVVFSVQGYYLQTVQALVQQSVAWKMVNTLVRAHTCILPPTTVAKPHPDKSNQQANKAADFFGQEKSGVKSWDGRQQQIHSLDFFPN